MCLYWYLTEFKRVRKFKKYFGSPLRFLCFTKTLHMRIGAAIDPVCYFIQNRVLMRKWRPPDVSADEEWGFRYQIIVPKSYQLEILSLAHDTPLSGHLGINKTLRKITTHFYWPDIQKDVAEFCKTCHTCQMAGKPNQVIPKVPLKPIPAFEEPFS